MCGLTSRVGILEEGDFTDLLAKARVGEFLSFPSSKFSSWDICREGIIERRGNNFFLNGSSEPLVIGIPFSLAWCAYSHDEGVGIIVSHGGCLWLNGDDKRKVYGGPFQLFRSHPLGFMIVAGSTVSINGEMIYQGNGTFEEYIPHPQGVVVRNQGKLFLYKVGGSSEQLTYSELPHETYDFGWCDSGLVRKVLRSVIMYNDKPVTQLGLHDYWRIHPRGVVVHRGPLRKFELYVLN